MEGYRLQEDPIYRVSSKSGLKKLRSLLWNTHRLDPDTSIVIIEGSAPPQYAGAPGEGAVIAVGFAWLEENNPQAFAEVVSMRLNNRTKPYNPTT